MKKLILLLFIASILNAQTYFDIQYNDGSPANSTDLSEIEKVTFSGNSINFELTNNSTVSKDMSTIDKITFSDTSDGNPVPVERNIELTPTKFTLNQNYPNPFNPTTTISYSLNKEAKTTLVVYDVLGNEVAELVDKKQQAGNYQVNFKADNLASGVYIARLKSSGYTASIKMLIMK